MLQRDQTNMLFYRVLTFLHLRDLVNMKVLSVMFKTYNNMPVPINVQCLFTEHVALHPCRLKCKYVRQCVRTNVK